MNWKTHVERISARNFVLPPGWDSREKVANDIECSPERVRINLAPAVKSGEVEVGVFPVWDSVTKRVVRTTAYRLKPVKSVKAGAK